MSDKNKDIGLQIMILIYVAGVISTLFFIYIVLEHGSRCQPYHLRSPEQQIRDAKLQHTLMDKEVRMLRLKIEKQELEKQLEPRIF